MNHSIAEETSKILIVDDEPLVLEALSITLEREGFTVLRAANGKDAIEILRQESPALIICDQMMPGMSGIEVMQMAQQLSPNTSRILLTASHDASFAVEAINVGHVHHYLLKPWQINDLNKIVRTALDTYKLIRENILLQSLIKKQHKELELQHESLRHELHLGAVIQEQLLIGKIPKGYTDAIIEATSVPSKEIDGDFYEFYQPAAHIIDVAIGDVMGKGIAAALVGTAVKTQLMHFALPVSGTRIFEKTKGWHSDYLTPTEILSNVDREISSKLIELEYFVTLFYARFDFRHHMLQYIDCGSTKPIHYRSKEKKAAFLEGDNLPLGVQRTSKYLARDLKFNENDLFIFYSDGVTDATSKNNEQFGMSRLLELIKKHHTLNPKELKELIKQAVFNFSQQSKLNDDLTIIVIKISPLLVRYEKDSSSTTFYGDLSQLPEVRAFIQRICLKATGNRERLSEEAQLIADEAFCNIIKHGKIPEGSGIKFEAELKEGGLHLKISDQGEPFDPARLNEPSFFGNQDSGYGWHLIKGLSDYIAYSPKRFYEDWNQLYIFKHFYYSEGSMNISHKSENDILVIEPEGESLDAKDAPSFKEGVINLINDYNPSGVVLDLNQIKFIDSSGLGTFLSVLRILNSRNGDLKLSRMNRTIRTMFELVKMHKIFEIFNTTDDAVNSFKNER